MDVFNLFAKIILDPSDYEAGLEEAGKKTSSFGEKLEKGLSTAAKAGTAAITAASTAISFLTKESVGQYSQYEQLIGGVETLFNETALSWKEYADAAGGATDDVFMQWSKLTAGSRKVIDNAANAFKTAGLSANQYMETVTSFAASLLQSLDGDTNAAAEYADMAITDMSDNANKMGTSMESIQNAYQGFAKQNYTMLDNLKLGYGGTKSEMERLLADATALSGIEYDISSYADIVDAIHVVQTEMGITGTTALEASTTIEGSVNSAKAAWANLITGIADENADVAELVDAFAGSVLTASENIIPRVMQVLDGVGDAILELSPVISEAVPELVETILPELISAGATLLSAVVNGVVSTIPSLYNALMDSVETILTDVFGVSEENAKAFSEGVTKTLTAISDGFSALVTSAQTEGTFLNEVWTGLQETGQALGDFFTELFDVISSAFEWCVEQINTEGTVLNTYATKTWENIKTVVQTAINVVTDILKVFASVLTGNWSDTWDSVKSIASNTWDAVTQIVENCIEGLKVFLTSMYDTGKDLVGQLIDAMADKFEEIYTKASEWVQDNILSPIVEKGQALYNAGKDLIDQMWEGLEAAWSSVTAWWDSLSFSSKTAKATVQTSGNGIDGSHANGLDYVPFDNYVANLHKGETVLTAREAEAYRKGKNGNGVTFNGGINISYTANGETDEESVKRIAQMLQFELEKEMYAFA